MDLSYDLVNSQIRKIKPSDLEANARLMKDVETWAEERHVTRLNSIEDYDAAISSAYICASTASVIDRGTPLSEFGTDCQKIMETWFNIYQTLAGERARRIRYFRTGPRSIDAKSCCDFCKSEDNLHVHHIIPLHLGGKHKPDNCMTVCAKCHILMHQNISKIVQGAGPIPSK